MSTGRWFALPTGFGILLGGLASIHPGLALAALGAFVIGFAIRDQRLRYEFFKCALTGLSRDYPARWKYTADYAAALATEAADAYEERLLK
jgi:hypothetical protein